MKSLLVLVALASSAYADTFPKTGPCDDVDACEKLCKRKAVACTYGGVLALQSAVAEDSKARAQTLFVKGCTKGDGEACWFATQRESDATAQRKLLEKGCAKQHVRSCFRLATVVSRTPGDDQAEKAAAVIYKRVAKLLEPRCTKKKEYFACDALTNLYASGQGVAKDEKKAGQYQQRACRIKTGQPCAPSPPPPPPGPPQTKAD